MANEPSDSPHSAATCVAPAGPSTIVLPPEGAPLVLGEELARGGMGAVLRARDESLARDVAVKVLLEEHQGKPQMVLRFLEEARVAGQLQHPGVVPVYGAGRLPDGRPCFQMKLVKGRTLAEWLA